MQAIGFEIIIVVLLAGFIICLISAAIYAMAVKMGRGKRFSAAYMDTLRDVFTVIIMTLAFGTIALAAWFGQDYIRQSGNSPELVIGTCLIVILLFVIIWLICRRKVIKGGKFYWREGGMKFSPWG